MRIDRDSIPTRNRSQHGQLLLHRISALKSELEMARTAQVEAGIDGRIGLQVEFESFPDVELAFESLARENSGIELMNVRYEDGKTFATVFVPDGKLNHFERLINDYLTEKRDKNGRLRDNRVLLETIAEIRAASLKALWTDETEVFPTSDSETFWWEVWLPIRGNRERTLRNFKVLAGNQGFRLSRGTVNFPERTVILAYCSTGQMKQSILTLNSIAELRRAKDTAEFFDALAPLEQQQWLEDFLSRATFVQDSETTPYVCLLDTGVNNGHSLIASAIAKEDLHSIDPNWGLSDAHGHGTGMAGLAIVGNLTPILASNEAIDITHRLESVKLLPSDCSNGNESEHHGYLTIEAVARPEVTAPMRRRVFGMAVTAKDNRDRGRPTAWSATIDQLAADADGNRENPRLFIISAGNIKDRNAWRDCPDSNSTDGIHDPAQSWNALTVGAYTELVDINEPDSQSYRTIAPAGGLSPFSTTSQTWQPRWPLKPDVVFEGGNAADCGFGPETMPSLSLLTTHHRPHERLFTTTDATSAATALASKMAAQIMAEYPELWPETVRGLMVHSAEWTQTMRRQFLPTNGQPSKADYERLIRHCGFGVPNLQRAKWSVSNSLTIVGQEIVRPFQRRDNGQPTYRDMKLHKLPWPLDELESLGETPVEMRVTLSYFIEPNPSQRGAFSRYRYESHGLRFDVKRALESEGDFLRRINAAAREEEEGTQNTAGNDPAWLLGVQRRHKGSIHSDIWRGTGVELASRGVLAVYPTLGWWKTRYALERYASDARYSLIVSIHAPEVDIDLYSSIAVQLSLPVEISV